MKLKYLTKLLSFTLLFFTAFPYITLWISPMPTSYIQPYSLIIGIILIMLNFSELKSVRSRENFFILFSLIIGVIVILASMLLKVSESKSIESYLNLGYLSPFSFILLYLAYRIAVQNISRSSFVGLLKFAILTYLVVGSIQILVDPNFLTSVVGGEKTALYGLGGRGTISLASEPSYYAFQIMALGAILSCYGSTYFFLMVCIQVIFFAASATGVLILTIAMIAYLITNYRKYGIYSFIVIMLTVVLIQTSIPDNSRLFVLLGMLFSGDFLYFITVDQSASERIAHAVLPYVYLANNYFLPMGIFNLTWAKYLDMFDLIWFAFLPENTRIMSGFGEMLVLYGVFVFPLLVKFTKNILGSGENGNNKTVFWRFCLFSMMFATFSFSTPVIALALVIYENVNKDNVSNRT